MDSFLYVSTFCDSRFAHLLICSSNHHTCYANRKSVKNENDSMIVTWNGSLQNQCGQMNALYLKSVGIKSKSDDESWALSTFWMISHSKSIGISSSVEFVIYWQNSKFHRWMSHNLRIMLMAASLFMILFFYWYHLVSNQKMYLFEDSNRRLIKLKK